MVEDCFNAAPWKGSNCKGKQLSRLTSYWLKWTIGIALWLAFARNSSCQKLILFRSHKKQDESFLLLSVSNPFTDSLKTRWIVWQNSPAKETNGDKINKASMTIASWTAACNKAFPKASCLLAIAQSELLCQADCTSIFVDLFITHLSPARNAVIQMR